jgi:hypothetical protein
MSKVCSTCNLIKGKTQICIKWIKKKLKRTTHSQNSLHGDISYIIKRKKYKTVCAELAYAKWTSTEWSWFVMELVIVALFVMPLDYCNIQRVYAQR